MKKIMALLTLVAIYCALCGFTYNPEKTRDYNAEIDFGASTIGNNAEQIGFNYYGKKITVTDFDKTKKTGVAGAYSGNRNLGVRVNPLVFEGVHSVKAVVEWYDIDHGQDVNDVYFQINYFNLDGDIATTNNVKSAKTGKWVESEIIIDDIDLSNVGILNSYFPTANILIAASGTRIDMGTPDEADDYTGVLFASFKLEPLENAYKLAQTTEFENASWKAGSTDLAVNMQLHTGLTPLREITDASGVTASGKSYPNKTPLEFKFSIPGEKFEKVRTVNVSIKYFDDISTNAAYMELRWPTPVLGIKWENSYAQASERRWQQKTGLWQTMTFTLTNCDFTKLAGGYPDHNFQILTSNRDGDWGTPLDTSDDIFGLVISEITITPIPEYSFSGLKFTNSQDNQLTSLIPNELVNTQLTIERTGGSEKREVTLITTLCDIETDNLERISFQTRPMEPEDKKLFQTCFISPDEVLGKYINIMVWDITSGFTIISNSLYAVNQ